jgi:hypothetical protein
MGYCAWPEFCVFLGDTFQVDVEIDTRIILKTKLVSCWALVAHTYNPRYSGGRDQDSL